MRTILKCIQLKKKNSKKNEATENSNIIGVCRIIDKNSRKKSQFDLAQEKKMKA
jgi:hypothetical protein